MENVKSFVALYANNATRDVQVCKADPETAEAWDDAAWEDVECAEVFVGIVTACSAEEALAKVVASEGCHENSIRLIPISVVSNNDNQNATCAAMGGPCCMCKPGPCGSRMEGNME